jgi:cell division protease FtsH
LPSEKPEVKRDPLGRPTPPSPLRLLILFALLMGLLLMFFRSPDVGSEAAIELPYTAFKEAVRQGDVERVEVEAQSIEGSFSEPRALPDDRGTTRRFTTTLPPFEDPELMALLEAQDVELVAQRERQNWALAVLISLLPWVLLIGLFVFISRRMQQRASQITPGGPGIFGGFGRSRAKRYRKGESHTTFADVAGLEGAKRDLLEVIDYLRNPSRYRKIGAKVPKGILLMGPPGTGKTLLARAAAGEADVPFFSISGSEFIEMFVGVGASRVRDMFNEAKQTAPAIIFIDEIDSIGRARGTGLGGGHDEREQTLNQILSEMDGFSPHEAVVVLAGTNRPDVLDPALLRPGRFDRKITLDLPRKEARRQILSLHARRVKLATKVDMDRLAVDTVGFSGADLENLVNEAALLAARKRKDSIEQEDIEEARDKIVLGDRREDAFSERAREFVAYHEAGHALVSSLMPHAGRIRKVTIIPRGRALGATEQIPEEERHEMSQSQLIDRLAVMLGGRAAGLLVFNENSTGVDDDLKQATNLARRMVCNWGMSERIGPASFRHGEEHIFLGREMASPKRDFSEHTAQLIDEEIRRLLSEADRRAYQCLKQNRVKLDVLAKALLDHETVEEDELLRIAGDRIQDGPKRRDTGTYAPPT